MHRAVRKTIFHSVVPTVVLGVTAARHCAAIPDIREGITAASRIVKEHYVRTERALTTESQRSDMVRRDTEIELVIEGLARPRAVNDLRIALSRKSIVDGVGGRCVGEQTGLRIDAG